MNKFESSELTEFNLKKDEHLVIDTCGLLKIMRSDDEKLILVGDADHGIIDTVNPTPAGCADRITTLGFALDIGIRQERILTSGEGFYFGQKLTQTQSMRVITQTDFDKQIFEKAVSSLDNYYQSGEPAQELLAVHLRNLLDVYNNARLLFPSFYNESYLNLMRIIDAVAQAKGGFDFALAAAEVSLSMNQDIFDEVSDVAAYADRVAIANDVFIERLRHAQSEKFACAPAMAALDKYGQFIFSCFYSAYLYRNSFVHTGMPFPDVVKNAIGIETDAGTAYLHPAVGQSFLKIYRPDGTQNGDLMDIHEGIISKVSIDDFKDKHFKLLPTWHFAKRVARTALRREIEKL